MIVLFDAISSGERSFRLASMVFRIDSLVFMDLEHFFPLGENISPYLVEAELVNSSYLRSFALFFISKQ